MKKKSCIKVLSIILFCFLTFISAFAAYLRNIPMLIKQPDGTEIHCLATGDEFHNWLHDSNNYTIIQHPGTGYYVYAILSDGKLSASDHIVGKSNPALLGLTPGVNLPSEEIAKKRNARMEGMSFKTQNKSLNTGTINNIVIFIRFADQSEYTDSWATYNNNFNASSGVSMKNYFQTVSSSQLTISSTLYPAGGVSPVSYQDSHNRDYFEPFNAITNTNGYSTTDNDVEKRTREHTLLNAAATYCSTAIVASGLNIDQDSDGNIDNICFIIQGAVGAWNDLLWPHRWALFTQTVTIGGKRVYNYNFQLQGQFGVGVLCHEMFHTLGAPDLYHYATTGLKPVSKWDLMGATFTSYPQHMSAYMKKTYGAWFSTLPTITTAGTYTLAPLNTTPNACYKIASPNSATEYFMLEYRNASGTFEWVLPGSGLIISRINNSVSQSDGNKNGPPDRVYVYRPGGTTTLDGTVDLANFSSSVGRTNFTNTTDPRCFLSDNSDAGINITNITSAGTTISFDVSFPTPVVFNPPQNLTYSMNNRDCILSWSTPVNNGNTLSGFKVYQGGSLINTITNPATLSYTDLSLPDGSYNYHVTATYSSPVGESPASNHVLFTLSSTAPDYVINNETSSSGSVQLGSTITFNCDVDNIGTATGGASTLAYYISTDAILDGGDTQMDTDAVPALGIAGSSSQSTTVRIQSPTPVGTYYAIFVADDGSAVIELDENNNTAYVQFQVTSANPDLSLSSLDVTPASVIQGNTFTADCYIDNTSSVLAGASTLRYYLSADTNYDVSDLSLGSNAVSGITAGSQIFISSALLIPGSVAPGSWYVLFYADADNAVTESDETNNIGFHIIQVTAANPDLSLSSLNVAPATVIQGNTFSADCYVDNTSSVLAGTSTLRYYLSADTNYDVGDLSLGSNAVSGITAGSQIFISSVLLIPGSVAPGSWYVLFYADADNAVTESDETNNIGFILLTVQALALPDYVLLNPSAAPTTITVGDNVLTSVDVLNQSTSIAPATQINYYLSTDQTYDAGDQLLGTEAVAGLGANTTEIVAKSINIPILTTPGNWNIIFYVDISATVTEGDETNNEVFMSIQVIPRMPDLNISNESITPVQVYQGSSFVISCDVLNDGLTLATASTMKYYISDDTSFDVTDRYLGQENIPDVIASSQINLKSTQILPYDVSEGYKYVFYFCDAENVVLESDETNNLAYYRIEVMRTLPDLSPDDLLITPQIIDPGDSFDTSVDISNLTSVLSPSGTVSYYLSVDNIYDITDELLGTGSFPGFSGAETHIVIKNLTIPAGSTPGNYYIVIVVDKDDAIPESDESNNSVSGIIKIDDNIGINDNVLGEIRVFPNPADGKFYFESDIFQVGKYLVQVVSLSGKTVYIKEFYQGNMKLSGLIDISSESKGTYILRISAEKKEYLKKIIIR
ncbi:CARDB domain-containing protein [Bacteroidota bacterium]